MGVSDIRDAEGRGQIDKAVSVDIPEIGALRASPEDRHGIEGSDVAALDSGEAFGEGVRFRSRHDGAQIGRLGRAVFRYER